MKKFRGHLELPNGTFIELVNDDTNILKETAQAVLKGGCRFDPAGSTAGEGSLLVYHPTVDSGKTIIGWIAPTNVVAEPMTNVLFVEKYRLQRAA